MVSLAGLFCLHMVNTHTVLPTIAAPRSLDISGFTVDLERSLMLYIWLLKMHLGFWM